MINSILVCYAYLFGRPFFRRFNTLLYQLSLRGLGVLNCRESISGENKMLQKLSGILSKNPVVFDVGANVGIYSKNIINIINGSKIYAFEPHPKNFSILKRLSGVEAVG